MMRSWLVCALAAVHVGVLAAEPAPTVVPVHHRPPEVSFDLYVHGPDGALVMPPALLPSKVEKNAAGLDVLRRGGVDHFHVANISAQAAAMSNADIDMPPVLPRPPGLSDSQKVALAWLAANAIDIGGGAVVWQYTFEHVFNNMLVKGGWPSSFGQADVIKALLVAYRATSDKQYLALAKRAAYAFAMPCEQGGLRCEVGGVPWFEEVAVPDGYAPMILNGHLYATVMLHRLWKETRDARVRAAFQEGLASTKRMLLRFDTGYWSTYQNRPRTVNLPLTLKAGAPGTILREVKVASRVSSESSITFGPQARHTYPGNTAVGTTTPTADGALLPDAASVQLTPGRLSVENDAVNFPGFELTVRYAAKDCAPIRIGTIDWRYPGSGIMEVPDVKVESRGGECIARGLLSTNINQWTSLNTFYHDWHTRLVTELWRISGDPLFYATALRWRGYVAVFEAQRANASQTRFLQPVFTVRDAPKEDALVMQALGGTDPAKLTPPAAADSLRAWAASHRLSAAGTSELLTRIGVAADSLPADRAPAPRAPARRPATVH